MFINPQGFGLNEFEAGLKQTEIYMDVSTHKPIISNLRTDAKKLFMEYDSIKIKTENNGTYEIGVLGFVNPLVMVSISISILRLKYLLL